MSTLFISHSSKDNDLAREVEAHLAQNNFTSVFLDLDPEKGITAGQSWEKTLYRKIRACRAVVAVCTDNYLASKWCFAEIALARMEGKAVFALKMSPLADDTALPGILTDNQFVDMRSDPGDGYQRLMQGLQALDLRGEIGDWNPVESPYLGLSSFHEKHAPVFFGRETESNESVELLERGAPNLVMILGASGSGKSSLVRAGILPRLRRNPDRWLVVEPFRPGVRPFDELADALIRTMRRYAPEHTAKFGDTAQLARQLKQSSDSRPATTPTSEDTESEDDKIQQLLHHLVEIRGDPPEGVKEELVKFLDWSIDDLQRICGSSRSGSGDGTGKGSVYMVDLAFRMRRAAGRTGARVLVFIDQFEELLEQERDDPDIEAFLGLLRASIEAEGSPLMILTTLRSDFLNAFQRNSFLQGIDFASKSLGPMRLDGLRSVIEEPARLGAIELESGLADRLLEDIETPDALPLLSFTLWILWRDYRRDGNLSITDYEEIGGLDGAITREADALLKGTDEAALEQAFLQMARLTQQGGYVRKPVSWDSEELVPVHGVLERFVDRRLLFIREENGQRIVEVAHESLFRAWKPLKKWLDRNRSDILMRDEIARESRVWKERDYSNDHLWRGARLQRARELIAKGRLEGDEKYFIQTAFRRQRVRRLFVTGVAALIFTGMAVLTLLTWFEQDETQRTNTRFAAMNLDMMQFIGTEFVKFGANQIGAHVGHVVMDETLLKARSDDPDANSVLAAREYKNGRIIALGHEVLLTNAAKQTEFVLRSAINWSGGDTDKTVLYSVGHCEIVSESKKSEFSLPRKLIEEWGYTLEPIQDLSDVDRLSTAGVLIIGNAWAEISSAEQDAVDWYIGSGGGLIMAGLEWSWEKYRSLQGEFDPCSFHPESKGRSVGQTNYPMNSLGEKFGVKWVSHEKG